MLLSVSFLGFFLAGIILLFSSYRKNKNAYLAAYLLFSNLFSLTYWLIFQSDSSTFSAFFAIHITSKAIQGHVKECPQNPFITNTFWICTKYFMKK